MPGCLAATGFDRQGNFGAPRPVRQEDFILLDKLSVGGDTLFRVASVILDDEFDLAAVYPAFVVYILVDCGGAVDILLGRARWSAEGAE